MFEENSRPSTCHQKSARFVSRRSRRLCDRTPLRVDASLAGHTASRRVSLAGAYRIATRGRRDRWSRSRSRSRSRGSRRSRRVPSSGVRRRDVRPRRRRPRGVSGRRGGRSRRARGRAPRRARARPLLSRPWSRPSPGGDAYPRRTSPSPWRLPSPISGLVTSCSGRSLASSPPRSPPSSRTPLGAATSPTRSRPA